MSKVILGSQNVFPGKVGIPSPPRGATHVVVRNGPCFGKMEPNHSKLGGIMTMEQAHEWSGTIPSTTSFDLIYVDVAAKDAKDTLRNLLGDLDEWEFNREYNAVFSDV